MCLYVLCVFSTKQEEQKKTLMTHDTDTHSYTYYIEEVNITTTKIIINNTI